MYDDHIYRYISDGAITASLAHLRCREIGAMLVSVNTDEELEFIKSEVLRGRTLSAFIGASDNKQGNKCLMIVHCIAVRVTGCRAICLLPLLMLVRRVVSLKCLLFQCDYVHKNDVKRLYPCSIIILTL